jgi:hypothetical protein
MTGETVTLPSRTSTESGSQAATSGAVALKEADLAVRDEHLDVLQVAVAAAGSGLHLVASDAVDRAARPPSRARASRPR